MQYERIDWTNGVEILLYLLCLECARAHYLPVRSCPDCGGSVEPKESGGLGTCVAVSTVPAKYALGEADLHVCMVQMDEGFRLLSSASLGVTTGVRVKIAFEIRDAEYMQPVATIVPE